MYNRLCTKELLGLVALNKVPGPGTTSCLTVIRTVQHETDVCVGVHRDGKAELCALHVSGTLLWSQVCGFVALIIILYAACGCWMHHFWEHGCAADAVPPVSSKLVLILLTSEG